MRDNRRARKVCSMKSKTFRIRGDAGLILHNARLSDPLDPWAMAVKEISGKRKKSTDDLIEMAKREFLGSMYEGEGGPCIPAQNLERLLRDGATHMKLGKVVQSSLIVLEEAPIIYEGPKDYEKLWSEERFRCRASCKVKQSRVIRTRPIFLDWSLEFTAAFHEERIDEAQVDEILNIAGLFVGLGDWRPRHGRFSVE